MTQDITFDYSSELDILHVYSSEIQSGIKGCLSYGNFNLDIGQDDKVVGVELEGASSILNMVSQKLEKLDNVNLIVRKEGNILFIGLAVTKGQEKSTIQINVPTQRTPMAVAH